MSTATASISSPMLAPALDPRRWIALAIVSIAQLMIIVDSAIVLIALPPMQKALHISTTDRQWVVTAYTLAFGGLLLLGGRIADYLGRKRVFIIGLLGFAVASATGGLATEAWMLFASRAVQGAFAAIMAPAALSLLTVTFTDPRERAKAFGVFASVAGGGATIGLVAGGLLTEYASWRWCLLVNVPIGLLTALAGYQVLRESKAEGSAHYDIPGAVTVTAGLVSLVYGSSRAADHGWSSAGTLSFLVAAAVLMVAFVVIEWRVANPLLPLRVITERNRAGAFLASLLVGAGIFGMSVFLSYYLQVSLGYSAVKTGLAFVPFSIGTIVGAMVASKILPLVPPRIGLIVGLVPTTVGMIMLATVDVDSGYVTRILPALIVTSIGLGLAFVSFTSASLFGVAPNDAGVASALVNATQQIGSTIGAAVLNTVAITATTSYLKDHGGASSFLAAATVHGYDRVFLIAGVVIAVSVLLVLVLVNAKAEGAPTDSGIGEVDRRGGVSQALGTD
ncbi:MAG TPA: MFS transporter [Thermomicrobiales bacterium]|nr:MFS transporter [Thermomicrobiales bacterium]